MTPLVVASVMVGAIAIIIAIGTSIPVMLAYVQTNETTYQTYENETANIRVHYPANWFSETRNLESPLTVRFFPTEFMAERYPPVVLGINFFNASNSSISLNLTDIAYMFEPSSSDARIINSTVNATLFNGTVPAFQVNYFDFSRPYMDTEEMIIGTFHNNTKTAYILQYYAEPEYFDKYLPEAQKMINSLQLLRNESRSSDVKVSNNSDSSFYQTFKDETINFKIQYPAGWMTDTKNLGVPEIVSISPKEFMAERYPPVKLKVGFVEKVGTTNITEFAEVLKETLESNPDSRVINSTVGANITLLNGTQPAVLIHAYDFTIPFHDRQTMTMTTVLDNGNGYYVEYYAEPENFDRYLPQAQKMINSFQLLSNST